MKKIVLILFLLFSFSEATAQDTNKILVDKSLLTEQQKQIVETQSTVHEASEWVGLGKEVGEAVNGGLKALTETAVDFSQTDLGFFTMFLIAYKVVGTDIIQIVLGFFLFTVTIGLFIFSYWKNCVPKKVCIKKNEKGEEIEWEVINSDYQDRAVVQLSHVGVLILLLVINSMIMFI